MNYTKAIKFIDGKLFELIYQMKLQPGKEQEKRINEEMNFLMYVRGLCERAKPLDVTQYERPVDIKAFDGTDKVLTYKCYPCPHCGNWVVNNAKHHYCEWCGQALDFTGGKSQDKHCCFCGILIDDRKKEHNPAPAGVGVCCEKCNNEIVIPARFAACRAEKASVDNTVK